MGDPLFPGLGAMVTRTTIRGDVGRRSDIGDSSGKRSAAELVDGGMVQSASGDRLPTMAIRYSLGFALLWAVLAVARPGTTFHLAAAGCSGGPDGVSRPGWEVSINRPAFGSRRRGDGRHGDGVAGDGRVPGRPLVTSVRRGTLRVPRASGRLGESSAWRWPAGRPPSERAESVSVALLRLIRSRFRFVSLT